MLKILPMKRFLVLIYLWNLLMYHQNWILKNLSAETYDPNPENVFTQTTDPNNKSKP